MINDNPSNKITSSDILGLFCKPCLKLIEDIIISDKRMENAFYLNGLFICDMMLGLSLTKQCPAILKTLLCSFMLILANIYLTMYMKCYEMFCLKLIWFGYITFHVNLSVPNTHRHTCTRPRTHIQPSEAWQIHTLKLHLTAAYNTYFFNNNSQLRLFLLLVQKAGIVFPVCCPLCSLI